MDYYGREPSSDFFMHYGIKGMKWGVRKFAKDKYAHKSDKFNALYGEKASKVPSARKMRRHYNALDQSKANINQRMRGDFEDFMAKHIYYDAMKKSNSPTFDDKKEKQRLNEATKKYAEQFKERKDVLDNIGKMQAQIASRANKIGYDGYYRPIVRTGIVGIPTKMQGHEAKYVKAKSGKKAVSVKVLPELMDQKEFKKKWKKLK